MARLPQGYSTSTPAADDNHCNLYFAAPGIRQKPCCKTALIRDASAMPGRACILAEGHQKSSRMAAVASELDPQSSGGGNGCDEAEVDAVVFEVRALRNCKDLG